MHTVYTNGFSHWTFGALVGEHYTAKLDIWSWVGLKLVQEWEGLMLVQEWEGLHPTSRDCGWWLHDDIIIIAAEEEEHVILKQAESPACSVNHQLSA